MRVSNTLFLFLVTSFPLAACGYDCGTRERAVADGTVRNPAGLTLATVHADLSDNVGPSSLRFFVTVSGETGSNGAPLRGHVTSARFVSESGELIADIPLNTGALIPQGVVTVSMDLQSRADYTRIRSAILSARTKLILNTDLSGLEHIETTLAEVHDAPSQVQRCSHLPGN